MKSLLIFSGLLSLGIGAIGIVLPVLPTTPFLLLTGYLFTKSNSKYSEWFKNTKIYQKYLSDFIEEKTMTFKQKWTLLILVDAMLLVSFVSIQSTVLRIFIITLIVVKHWYFHKYIKVK